MRRHRGSFSTVLVLLAVLGTAACATPDQWAEWRRHSSHFASGNHLAFSVTHRGEQPAAPVTRRDVDRARAEVWWGDPLVPDQVLDVRPEGR